MLPPTNFGRCVAVKIGAEKVAINPPQMADAQADGPETHTIGPLPERTWAQYLAQMRRGYNRSGLHGIGDVIAADAYRQNQQRQMPRIGEMMRQYSDGNIPGSGTPTKPTSYFPDVAGWWRNRQQQNDQNYASGKDGYSSGDSYATNVAVETLSNPKERETFLSGMRQRMSDFYDWGSTPIGTDAYAKKNNLSHLPRQEQAAEYLRHLAARQPEDVKVLDQTIEDAVAAAKRSVIPPRLAAWWLAASDNYLGTKFNVKPDDITDDDMNRYFLHVGDNIDTAANTTAGAVKQVTAPFARAIDTATSGLPGEGIGAALRGLNKDLNPVAWGAQARKQLGWDTAQQQQTAPPPPPQSNFWNDAKRTMADSGKKLQELMRDPTFAAAIAVPTLGLGAYGIYDLLRNKKRRKRPKFYDENAREF